MYLTKTSAIGILALVAFFAMAIAQFAHADTYHTQHTDNPHNVGSGGSMTMYGHHNASTGNPGWTFLTRMTGSEEVPPVSTQTTGDGGVWFGNDGSGMSAWTTVWRGDDITQAHLHCGDPGENGPPVVTLYHNDSGADINGVLAHKSVTDSMIMGANCAPLIGYNIANTHDLAHAIENGDIYMNVHDKAHPNGVIRGQLGHHQMPPMGGGGSGGGSHDDKHGDRDYGKGHDRDHDSEKHWSNDHDSDRSDHGNHSYDSDHSKHDSDRDHREYGDSDRHGKDGDDGRDGRDGRDGKDGRDGNDGRNESHSHSSSRSSGGNAYASSYSVIRANSTVIVR